MNSFDVNLTGELYELPGGALAIAVGYQRYEQSYAVDYDDEWTTFNRNVSNIFGKTLQADGAGENREGRATFGIGIHQHPTCAWSPR